MTLREAVIYYGHVGRAQFSYYPRDILAFLALREQ